MKEKPLKCNIVRIDLVLLNSHNSNVYERESSYKYWEIKKQHDNHNDDNLIIVHSIIAFMGSKSRTTGS